ncbi:uncharacterized protein LOC115889050 [Sitophilus oryzae]|uniref:Uncharacterized protein LOC115889050 n=1 Tax=Sitophilus oryzae TaxID=7048 RepID=A0A6J2YNK7_SITOR|nr:uncharacterized protein LOC115889050 [Sitophilus oryzae]
MKWSVAVVLCLAFAVVFAITAEEGREKFKKAHEKCQTDPATAADEEELKAYKTEHKVTEGIKIHALCVSKTLGWQHQDGKINKESVKEKIVLYLGQTPKLDEIHAECVVDKENEKETAINLFKCYYKYFAHKTSKQ